MNPIQEAAVRLVAAIDETRPACDAPESVQRGATLATALQSVLAVHIMAGSEATESEDTEAMIAGIASTVGWILARSPPAFWVAGIELLANQSLAAIRMHAQIGAAPRPTVQ